MFFGAVGSVGNSSGAFFCGNSGAGAVTPAGSARARGTGIPSFMHRRSIHRSNRRVIASTAARANGSSPTADCSASTAMCDSSDSHSCVAIATSSPVSVYFANTSHPQSGSALGHSPLAGGGVALTVRLPGTFEFRRLAMSTNFCVLPTLGGVIPRLRTLRRSTRRISVKHMGHLAGFPSPRVVKMCLAMHGKQNECPHTVICGATGASSKHTGQLNGSTDPASTCTTSSQLTI